MHWCCPQPTVYNNYYYVFEMTMLGVESDIRKLGFIISRYNWMMFTDVQSVIILDCTMFSNVKSGFI